MQVNHSLLVRAGAWCAMLVPPLGGPCTAAATAVPAVDEPSNAAAPADVLLLHGKIHTEDSERRVVEALALRGNTIVAVGTDDEIAALTGPQSRTVDLAGRVVLPGIIDAHTHPAESAQNQDRCSLGDEMITPNEIENRVGRCLAGNPGKQPTWFEVVQVNPSGLTLTRADLDAMLGERPLLLDGSDGHTVWANSAALAAAHIGAATPDPVGGHIERDAAGEATGTLRDTATELVTNAKPPTPIAREAAQLAKAFAAMRATGITSVQDASVDDHDMRIYKRLYDRHRLHMRVRGSFTIKNLHAPAAEAVAAAIAFRKTWAVDPDFLRADAVKIFADGVIEYPSQTAALLEPYLAPDGPPTTNRGPSYFDQENLNRIVAGADEAGFTVHVHAIGDRAVRSALDAFAYARAQGASSQRDQIAHLELIDPADFGRFKALGVIANFQLLWAQDDPYVERATIPFLGPERSRYLYPVRSLRDAGALIAAGSDWDVSSFNAFEAMEHAVTRKHAPGDRALLPEQAITLQQAVDAYTIDAAYALRQERTTGSLEAGKRGDLIVLDQDIFAVDVADVHATRVLATYLDGRLVYSRPRQRGGVTLRSE
jgi:predicted amidohydrolase YtcJ